jgi:hypothetical protein
MSKAVRRGILLVVLAAAVGCSNEMPFDVVPISGKVTYDDGALIKTGSISLTFNPIDAQAVDKMTPPGGHASVNIADGTFSDVMTRRPGDGVLVGRHKVVVASFDARADGRPVPSDAVPPRYHKLATTPLEIEVKPAEGQFFAIKVARK